MILSCANGQTPARPSATGTGPYCWTTQVGDNELKDPKAESWQFLPEPAGAEEAHRPGAVDRDRPGYVEGISTRSVDDPRVSADMVAAALRTVFVHSDPQGLSAARAPSGTH
jgi:hypothetical protein